MTRRSISALIIIIILYIAFVIVQQPIKALLEVIFPPKDLPNPIYGQIDSIIFTETQISSTTLAYELNTKTGGFPKFPNKMTVYKYKSIEYTYEGGKIAQLDAKTLGYINEDLVTSLRAEVYKWKDKKFGGSLEININTTSLKLNTPLAGKQEYFKQDSMTVDSAVGIAKKLFTSIERYDEDLYQNGTQEVVFGKILETRVIEAASQPEAHIARVDFFRSINKYPILGPVANEGLLFSVVREYDSENPKLNYPIIEAYVWEIEPQSNATYPIIPPQAAWQAVSSGKGVISSVVPKTKSPFEPYKTTRVEKILINEVYLAYYDSQKPQTYLQPMYVFEGNYLSQGASSGKIFIYYPAISSEYIKAPSNQKSQE